MVIHLKKENSIDVRILVELIKICSSDTSQILIRNAVNYKTLNKLPLLV